jgi:hypothetical protein
LDRIDLYSIGSILHSIGSICIVSDRFVFNRIDLYWIGSICIQSDRFCIQSDRFVLYRIDLYSIGSICIQSDRFVLDRPTTYYHTPTPTQHQHHDNDHAYVGWQCGWPRYSGSFLPHGLLSKFCWTLVSIPAQLSFW